MPDPVAAVLGGIAVASISAAIGKHLGDRGKVSESQCVKNQSACSALLVEKIDNLTDKVSDLKSAVDNKLLNL